MLLLVTALTTATTPPTLLPWDTALRTVAPVPADQAVLDKACGSLASALEQQRCLLNETLQKDATARAKAVVLLERHGHLVGVTPAFLMDGGFRGDIHIEPALPVGPQRKHLQYVDTALTNIHAFMEAVTQKASQPVAYVWRPLPVRFFISVKRGTPSAYVDEGGVAYNLRGSLHKSAAVVTETLFHELFHHNDGLAGGWSTRVLGPVFEAIVQRCNDATACLAPYAPHSTRVKGGTYYAFQPGNGVEEYAAELAVRYWREQQGALVGRLVAPAFKCGPPQNAQAWTALKDRFFGGVDWTAACRAPP